EHPADCDRLAVVVEGEVRPHASVETAAYTSQCYSTFVAGRFAQMRQDVLEYSRSLCHLASGEKSFAQVAFNQIPSPRPNLARRRLRPGRQALSLLLQAKV